MLPECMMPDGAAPCEAYQKLHEELAELKNENWMLVQALQARHAKPMSNEQIGNINQKYGWFEFGDAQGDKTRAFVRQIEEHHGILDIKF